VARSVRQRRAFVALFGALALGFGLLAACSFPDVTFTAGPGTGNEGGNPDGGDGGTDASEDARILVDGADPDALIEKDSGKKVDAAGCDPSDCDCDKDGFRNTQKAGCEGGANDCDDNDTRAQPNKGYLLDLAEEPVFGDWNCANGVEPLYPENFDCTTRAPGATTCDNAGGFTGTVGCGKFGTLVKCKTVPEPVLGLTKICVGGTPQPNTQQACK
jgi:hypothetical protein